MKHYRAVMLLFQHYHRSRDLRASGGTAAAPPQHSQAGQLLAHESALGSMLLWPCAPLPRSMPRGECRLQLASAALPMPDGLPHRLRAPPAALRPPPPPPRPRRGTVTAVALTISAMSILTSISASFATGLTYGGPAVCVWGWVGEAPRARPTVTALCMRTPPPSATTMSPAHTARRMPPLPAFRSGVVLHPVHGPGHG